VGLDELDQELIQVPHITPAPVQAQNAQLAASAGDEGAQ
jgi:hypothetical protein